MNKQEVPILKMTTSFDFVTLKKKETEEIDRVHDLEAEAKKNLN